jgi:hypothetical protein
MRLRSLGATLDRAIDITVRRFPDSIVTALLLFGIPTLAIALIAQALNMDRVTMRALAFLNYPLEMFAEVGVMTILTAALDRELIPPSRAMAAAFRLSFRTLSVRILLCVLQCPSRASDLSRSAKRFSSRGDACRAAPLHEKKDRAGALFCDMRIGRVVFSPVDRIAGNWRFTYFGGSGNRDAPDRGAPIRNSRKRDCGRFQSRCPKRPRWRAFKRSTSARSSWGKRNAARGRTSKALSTGLNL